MLKTIAVIAAGGAAGAILRYGVNVTALKAFGSGFPWGTFCVNILGSFLMGLAIASFAHLWQPSETFKLFLITGFLGAFTTFSAFSLDASTLFERHAYGALTLYVGGSVFLSIGALFAGMALLRQFAS